MIQGAKFNFFMQKVGLVGVKKKKIVSSLQNVVYKKSLKNYHKSLSKLNQL